MVVGSNTYYSGFNFIVGTEIDLLVKRNDQLTDDLAVKKTLPTSFALGSYPNPFNPSTVIGFQLPVDSDVKLSIYDMLGREVVALVNGTKEPGYHTATFNADKLPSGIYFARLSVTPSNGSSAEVHSMQAEKPFVHTIKMQLVK